MKISTRLEFPTKNDNLILFLIYNMLIHSEAKNNESRQKANKVYCRYC